MQNEIEVVAGPPNGLAHFDQYMITVPVGGKIKPHFHETKEETYFIVQGRARMRLGDMENDIGPKTLKIIPKGTVHGIRNIGDEALIVFSTANIITTPDFHPVDQ